MGPFYGQDTLRLGEPVKDKKMEKPVDIPIFIANIIKWALIIGLSAFVILRLFIMIEELPVVGLVATGVMVTAVLLAIRNIKR